MYVYKCVYICITDREKTEERGKTANKVEKNKWGNTK